MFRHISIGIKAYIEAHRFIKKHNLWKYVLLPGVFNALLFIASVWVGWSYSDDITSRMMSFFGIDSPDGSDSSLISVVLNYLFLYLFKLMFLVLFLYVYKYIVLILMAPILAILSEKVDAIINGKTYPFNMKQFIKDVVRGIIIAMRNVGIELMLLIVLFFIGFIPLIGWFAPFLMLIVQFYFYGFSMFDYCNERRNLSVSASSRFIYDHKWAAVTNGACFYLLLLIPFIGLLVAPTYAVTAATIVFSKLEAQKNITT